MTRKQLLIIALLVLANAVIFCGGISFVVRGLSLNAPASPTANLVSVVFPPTYTPTVLPPTPAPPTATPTSASSAAISAAMDKARIASSYRLTMDMSMKGDLGAMAPSAGSNAELSMLNMTSEVSGKDSHFVLKGFAAMIFTGDASKGMEMTQAGGKSYVHGPLPLLGAKDTRWYVLPAQATGASNPTAEASDMLKMFGDPSTDLGKFSKSGSETLDKARCDIYSADQATALKSFSALSSSGQIDSSELAALQGNLKDATFSLWICDDGYMHQLKMGFTAQDPSSSTKTLGINLSIHLYDFNSKIAISAPANAVPATFQFITTSTPTAKPAPTRTRTPTPKP